jgi:hypothetical protein
MPGDGTLAVRYPLMQIDGYRAAFEEMPDDSWKTM